MVPEQKCSPSNEVRHHFFIFETNMFENLEELVRKFESLEDALASGQLSGPELQKTSKERGKLEPLVDSYKEYKKILSDLDGAKEMLSLEKDSEMKKMAKEEVDELNSNRLKMEEHLTILTLPTDPNDDKNVIVEIRAGTGGEEAALFAADLFKMYTRYAEKSGWRTDMISSTESATDGFREVIFSISGNAVYSRLKFESGAHRVQRVPATESQGRVHTSACTVAILPEADEIDDVVINPADLDISTYRASGSGGQHVNTTDSAVRIVHKPSGLVVECQDQRSQHKNKDHALKVLSARLFDLKTREQHDEISADRKSQVGSGDRSERIRTYNFPQGRLTDHRINLTLYKLDEVMGGDISKILDSLGSHHQTELLKQQGDV
jgi:peptide chain release factor 1